MKDSGVKGEAFVYSCLLSGSATSWPIAGIKHFRYQKEPPPSGSLVCVTCSARVLVYLVRIE